MADITKCRGGRCPWRANCYRYTAPADPVAQSYFVTVPGVFSRSEFRCAEYWPDAALLIRDGTGETGSDVAKCNGFVIDGTG
ncbi:MAG: hypothetical protein GY851_35550 [bacterium]|nr:hypothetical protein [bacterium]